MPKRRRSIACMMCIHLNARVLTELRDTAEIDKQARRAGVQALCDSGRGEGRQRQTNLRGI